MSIDGSLHHRLPQESWPGPQIHLPPTQVSITRSHSSWITCCAWGGRTADTLSLFTASDDGSLKWWAARFSDGNARGLSLPDGAWGNMVD